MSKSPDWKGLDRSGLGVPPAPTHLSGKEVEWHGESFEEARFLGQFTWEPELGSAVDLYLYSRRYDSRDLWLRGLGKLREIEGFLFEYFLLEFAAGRGGSGQLYRLNQVGTGVVAYISSGRCDAEASVSKAPKPLQQELESKGVRRRDFRRFDYPLCGREWMRFVGSALDITGHDKDGPIGDRCFLFGASIEGERTYAIQTSELGAQDAEDHYALEGL